MEVEGLAKRFGGQVLFSGLSFSLLCNGIVGVLGPNGVGKTTLFRMLIGDEPPDMGTIRVGESVRMAYVDQGRARINPDQTAWELISEGHTGSRRGGGRTGASVTSAPGSPTRAAVPTRIHGRPPGRCSFAGS